MANIGKISRGKSTSDLQHQQRHLLVNRRQTISLNTPADSLAWKSYLDVKVETLQTLHQVSLALFGRVGHKLHGHRRLPQPGLTEDIWNEIIMEIIAQVEN